MTDYYSTHCVGYEEPKRIGYLCLEVLPSLKGRKWDEISLAYIHSLRPSGIRVTPGETTTNSMPWRVTVYVDSDNIIETIEQEVEIGLPEGVSHGMDLQYVFENRKV